MSSTAQVAKTDQHFCDEVAQFYYFPNAFVYWAFDWGHGELLGETGPDKWQIAILEGIRDKLLAGRGADEATREAIQIAVASGHGVGKTALISWIILWFISTRWHPQIVVTANTKSQLDSKTWRELSKWHRLYVLGDWFEKTATKLYMKGHQQTWFATAIPWTKENSEAFAGTHENEVLMLFDEASSITDLIWEVVEGAMTTGRVMWIAFGNPTRNTGRFRECFRKFRASWLRLRVDSREAKKTNKAILERQIADYGEDSDFCRVRVRGLFPRSGAHQLIGEDVVEMAQERAPIGYEQFPLIVGVDPARYGDDQTVIYMRQGNATRKVLKYREIDTMTCAGIISEWITKVRPRSIFVDEIGIGAGVVDRLNQLGHDDIVMGVNVAMRAKKDQTYANLRAEIWFEMRDWLKAGGCIDAADTELRDDLTGPEYFYDRKNRFLLESKDDMKDRGIPSPDTADALALTFSYEVRPEVDDMSARQRRQRRRRRSFMAR